SCVSLALFKKKQGTLSERPHLQDSYTDLMTENHQLQDIFSSLTQKTRVDLIAEISQLETRVRDLTDEKDQLQRDFDSLNKKGPVCFFKSTELKSWSDSRQYCRDRGADLVIINTEEKESHLFLFLFTQRFISSLVSERVWIGLSDTENEGIMKWVDNSRLKQGFWHNGEPNNQDGNEDCIELMPSNPVLNNWNDLPCSQEKKGFFFLLLSNIIILIVNAFKSESLPFKKAVSEFLEGNCEIVTIFLLL
uniref:Si:ch73-343l4.8 n=1 Tax=Sinocyclocheilus rhinocerous TaxID=307959 RepID=A0A673KSF8_9TELE